MNVVLLLMRTRLRSSWQAAIVLVVLLGLGGSVALAVAAGARRTASTNDAILRATNTSEINFAYGPADPREMEATTRPLAGVADVNQWVGFSALITGGDTGGVATLIGLWQDPVTVSRPVMIAGRMPTGADDVMVNESGARSFGLTLGDQVGVSLVSYDGTPPDPPTLLTVVGVGLLTDEVIEDELGLKPLLLGPRAYTEQHLDRAVWGKTRMDLAEGADPGPIVGSLAEKGLFVDELVGQDRARVQDALRPLLVTLGGLAGLAATATVLITGQALTRLLRRRLGDDASLSAMGCTTTQLVTADLFCAALVAGAGAVLAAAAAVAASPLFPVGPVRRTRVAREVDVDIVLLGAGGVALALAVVGLVGLGSWRRRSSTRPIAPGRAPGVLASRPATATGLRLGTAQRGVAVTVAGIATGLAVLVATVTFTGSLGRLIDSPGLVGLTWDLGGRNAFDSVDLADVLRTTDGDATVERVTGIDYLAGEANGQSVDMAVLEAAKGSPWPPLVAGRQPAAKDEVLVGRATLHQLGLRIGDTVNVSFSASLDNNGAEEPETVSRAYRVVGSAVAPAIGLGGTDTPKLDTGMLLTSDDLDLPGSATSSEIVLFDLTDGTDPDVLRARFPDGLPTQDGSTTEWFTSAAPAEVSQAGAARSIIWLALAALAAAIVGAIVHTLLGSVRQRRKEYAVLKALGFTRSQVRAVVLTQSGALLALALVVALPVGIAAGRWLWTGFADRIGLVADPTVPVLLLGGSVLATIALVQGAALGPAAVARRTSLTRTLQSE